MTAHELVEAAKTIVEARKEELRDDGHDGFCYDEGCSDCGEYLKLEVWLEEAVKCLTK